MVASRLQHGQSDPVSYTCTCGAAQDGGGLVLLFYRYYANAPRLPTLDSASLDSERVQEFADWQQATTDAFALTGKIRVATEGFNVTVAGTTAFIEAYIDACCKHWSFEGLPLASHQQRRAFFKPSPGCACVFAPATATAVRVCAEITPLGITNYAPTTWTSVVELEPADFHGRCKAGDVELMDLRNHYESRIGYFVKGSGLEPAIRPDIRRFSQWPRWALRRAAGQEEERSKQLLTYCTGGIRCEKATRWLAEKQGARQQQISTLKGGIAAYLTWVEAQVAAGNMAPSDSLFLGRNYVFDARGALGLAYEGEGNDDGDDNEVGAVSHCHACGRATSRLAKCSSSSTNSTRACHLVLVVCRRCGDAVCCDDCATSLIAGSMCACERAREHRLWSGLGTGLSGGAKSNKGRADDVDGSKHQRAQSRGLDAISSTTATAPASIMAPSPILAPAPAPAATEEATTATV